MCSKLASIPSNPLGADDDLAWHVFRTNQPAELLDFGDFSKASCGVCTAHVKNYNIDPKVFRRHMKGDK